MREENMCQKVESVNPKKKNSTKMKKFVFLIFILAFFLVGILFGLRFLLGGPEDDWICVNNQWVKHGNPRAPKPTGSCGKNSQIANPASIYCKEQGGNLEIKTATGGGQFGWCILPDGRECEEWEFFRTKTCQ